MNTPARILVVDDELGMLRATERVLGGPFVLTTTASSRHALDLAASVEPDLAILDIRMPDIDGFELMARLKARHPDLDVILMTGSVDDRNEKLVRALRGAAFYFIHKPFDRDALRVLVERCLELRQKRHENRRHVRRLEHELQAARAFQQSLLPPADAHFAGVAVACRQAASAELGGDLYDYVVGEGGQVALLVADVAGHGAMAAMLTGVVKSAFRAAEREGYAPLAVVERLSAALAPFDLARFVTLIAAVWSPATGLFTFVNAGHPSGLLWTPEGRVEWLAATGPLVSPALPDGPWTERAIHVSTGDAVLFFTDGVVEAFPWEQAELHLRGAIARHPRGGGALVDAILADVRHQHGGQSPQDDVTLVTAAFV